MKNWHLLLNDRITAVLLSAVFDGESLFQQFLLDGVPPHKTAVLVAQAQNVA